MKKCVLFLIVFSSLSFYSQVNWSKDSLFRQQIFIQNNGQYKDMEKRIGDVVLFGTHDMGQDCYFTETGLVFSFTEAIFLKEKEKEKKHEESEEEREKEHEMKFDLNFTKIVFENAQKPIVLTENESEGYSLFYVSKTNIKAKGYKKLIYNNIYPNIDIHFYFHKTFGLKYNIILKPGSNYKSIKMLYSKMNRLFKNSNGNIISISKNDTIVDHKPVSFYENSDDRISSEFTVNNNIVSFSLGQYDASRTVVIDPWLVNPSFTLLNKALQVEKDKLGNVYVLGGGDANNIATSVTPLQLKKYSAAGVFQWVFNFPAGCIGWYGDDLKVDAAGFIYVSTGINPTSGSPPGVFKMTAAGTIIWGVSGFEPYRVLVDNCNSNEIYISQGNSGLIVRRYDKNTGAFLGSTPSYSTAFALGGECRDMLKGDDGNYYGIGVNGASPELVKLDPTLSTKLFGVTHGYGFSYLSAGAALYTGHVSWQPGTMHNVLATKLFFYTTDGQKLERRSLATGLIINQIPIPGGAKFGNSGFAVDTCSNIYVGSSTGVYKYSPTLSLLGSAATSGAVYDICLGTAPGEILACGNGFLSAINLNACLPCPLNSTIAINPSSVCGCNGSATVTPFCGKPPYSYLWSNNTTGQVVIGLCPGNYSVVVTDINCDSDTTFFAVTGNTVTIPLSFAQTSVSCFGSATGSATVSPSGGSAPYTYLWSNGQTTQIATGLTAGQYTVTVTDNNNCISIGVVTITQPPQLLVTQSLTIPILPCPTGTFVPTVGIGASSFLITGGVGPYTYLWDNLFPGFASPMLAVGTHTFKVTDANGCIASLTFQVSGPAVPNFTINTLSASCLLSNGSATLLSQPNPTSTVLWTISSSTLLPSSGTVSNSSYSINIQNLAAGNYTINYNFTVPGFFALGTCQNTATFSIANTAAPLVNISYTNASCSNSLGVASASVSPAGTYTYSWSGGQTTSVVNNLPPGVHTVTVTSSSGCFAVSTVTILGGGTPPNLTAVSPVTLACNPNTATLSASSTATGVVTYTWSGPSILSGSATQTPVVNQAGNYTVTIAQGACTNTAVVSVVSNTNLPNISVTTPATLTCLTTSVTLTGNSTTGGVTYSWSPQNVATNTAVATSVGNYSFVVTNTLSGCVSTSVITVSQNTIAPNVSITQPATLTCLTTSVVLTGTSTTGGVTYSWSPQNVSTNTAIATSAGNYTFSVTNPMNGCTSTTVIVVSQNGAFPNISITQPTTLTCLTTSVTLTGNSTTSGVTYSWSPQSVSTNTAVATAAGNYTLTVTDPTNGCSTQSVQSVAQNTTVPNISATLPNTLTCLTTSIVLNGSSTTTGATFTWSPQNVSTNTAIATSSGNYTLTVTDPANGCSAQSVQSVAQNTVVPNISASAGGTLTCTNTSVTLSGNSTTAGATFTWQPLNVNTNTAVASSPGSYSLAVLDPSNGCSNSTVVAVVQNGAFPNISVTTPATLTCLTASVTLTGNSTTGGVTYSWSPQNVTTNTAVATSGGIYTLSVYDAINGCTSTSVIAVSQNTLAPTLTASFSNSLNCINTTATLTASSTNTGMVFVWNGGSLSNAVNPVLVSAAGNYSVTATDPTNGCTNNTVVAVSQNTIAPNVSVLSTGNINCSTPSATLTGSSTTGGVTYSWSPNISGSATLPTATANSSGNYTLTVTDPSNGCSTFTTIAVTSTPVFTANISVLNQINCNGANNGALQINNLGGGTPPFNITIINTLNNIGNISSFPINLNGLSAASYSILIIDANGCSQTLFANINQPPQLNVTVAGNSTLCAGTSASLSSNASGGTAPYAYAWSPSAGTSPNVIVNPGVNTSYTLTVTDNNGCTSSANIAIIVSPKPNASIINNSLVGCSPVCATFSLTQGQGVGYSYNWSFTNNQTNSVTVSSFYDPDICFNIPGTYNAGLLITTPAGCSTTVTYNNIISVYAKPMADFSASPDKPSILEPEVSFTNLSTGATNYTWYNVNTVFSTQTHPSYVFQDPGVFLVTLIASNGQCSDTLSKIVTIEDEFVFYIPNTFTPNDDNLNDFFYPHMQGYKDDNYNFMVFDRWGAQIFHTTNPRSKGWDGFYKGEMCKDDVYVWKVNVTTNRGVAKEFIGHVTLLK